MSRSSRGRRRRGEWARFRRRMESIVGLCFVSRFAFAADGSGEVETMVGPGEMVLSDLDPLDWRSCDGFVRVVCGC